MHHRFGSVCSQPHLLERLGLGWDQDPAAQYLERKDTIVSGAGDARDVNAATHIIDPWPRYVGNRRIPANGRADGGGCRTLSHEHAVGHALSDYADI